ncbi:SDR family oxidoreductase [Paenibacillus favisporus]|uniref:SDR family oxidoreductase n=1 Tax=Paenibacillus favisporus TaxID=221028 RepID=UPI0013D64848|nr:SDR family oxidoreductase [Paenibacillus favisporus]
MILVTGATGSVGREVVRLLHKDGYRVRALSRHPEKSNFPVGVEMVAGDLLKPESLSAALDGVEKVFWMLPLAADFNFPRIARQSGVRHIVLLSAATAEIGVENAIARLHLNAEQAVRESGTSWTFLRPSGFMTDVFRWKDSIRSEGVVQIPFGDLSIPVIDSRDTAAVAAKALSSDGQEGKVYMLTGPESLTRRQQAAIIGKVLGREIEFESIPDDLARKHLLRHMPAEMVEALFDLSNQGQKFSEVLPTVEEVTGQPPRTFQQWVTDHAEAFL